jgi:hypothetical protein
MALRDILIWIIQAVLFGIGIGIALLTAHLAGPLLATAFAIDELIPTAIIFFAVVAVLDRKQVLARRMDVQSPALASVAMAFRAERGGFLIAVSPRRDRSSSLMSRRSGPSAI